MELLPIILIAFLVAVLFSILGLGGAIVYTPLFFWLGLPLLAAIPTALLLNFVTTASASITYLKHGFVEKSFAFPMIFTSIFGAVAGSYLAHTVDVKLIILMLSAVIFIAGIRLLLFNSIGVKIKDKKIPLGTGAAFLIGVVSALVGIGGGTFMVPLLMVLGFETKNATATSAFIVTFISLSGFLGYLSFGFEALDLRVLLYAGAAAFIGAQVGSRIIFRRASSKMIEKLFAAVLLLVAGKLLYGLV